MKAFTGNLEHLTEANRDFRRVIYTGPHLQLVLMALQPGEEIGEEVHPSTDQFLRIEEGKGTVSINGFEMAIKSDMAVVIPAGARHNVRNTGKKTLKLYTVYAPPEHADGTVHRTRAEAEVTAEVP